MRLRDEIKSNDGENIKAILTSTDFFRQDEIEVAISLLNPEEYSFFFLEEEGRTIGFTCYSLIPCTLKNYDLYWIAVHKDFQSKGYGKILFDTTYDKVKSLGGAKLYIETSGKDLYLSTRKFYEKQGAVIEAVIKDFYNDNDDKYIYSK